MPEESVEDKEGMKIRKLVELRTDTAKEYETAMLSRVNEFKVKNAGESQFNDVVQNTIVKAFSTILDLKLQVDKALGEENLKKVRKVIDDILLTGL
ncbi:hypothetical protein LCGC14_0957420 [marine sediment metagenome]|uniref:Uncharacterized protein n=1 Tax=marine sediment metagenome TaxID=412755 RepID=A0A0F9NFJ9_9ZZZZ